MSANLACGAGASRQGGQPCSGARSSRPHSLQSSTYEKVTGPVPEPGVRRATISPVMPTRRRPNTTAYRSRQARCRLMRRGGDKLDLPPGMHSYRRAALHCCEGREETLVLTNELTGRFSSGRWSPLPLASSGASSLSNSSVGSAWKAYASGRVASALARITDKCTPATSRRSRASGASAWVLDQFARWRDGPFAKALLAAAVAAARYSAGTRSKPNL